MRFLAASEMIHIKDLLVLGDEQDVIQLSVPERISDSTRSFPNVKGSRAVILATSKSRRLYLRWETRAKRAKFVEMGHFLTHAGDKQHLYSIVPRRGGVPRVAG
jgi:hypothetical protein